ncbi:MAG TPA: CDP-diacylglycerol O-phosphatidyltransferase, partial [Rhodospirillaceae bacterium]|nr:CDP-diacylglycerol O-phosphatidyltransferase [Rhodospirillaceae bacterium]
FLMVSKIPTFSGKRSRIPNKWVLPVLLLVGVLAAFLVTDPWGTITTITVLYGASIPFSIRSFTQLRAKAAALRTELAVDPAASPAATNPPGENS